MSNYLIIPSKRQCLRHATNHIWLFTSINVLYMAASCIRALNSHPYGSRQISRRQQQLIAFSAAPPTKRAQFTMMTLSIRSISRAGTPTCAATSRHRATWTRTSFTMRTASSVRSR
jgi:hypothetical protein